MTLFGHAVLFDNELKNEDTASPKTPKQWHKYQTFNVDKALVKNSDWRKITGRSGLRKLAGRTQKITGTEAK